MDTIRRIRELGSRRRSGGFLGMAFVAFLLILPKVNAATYVDMTDDRSYKYLGGVWVGWENDVTAGSGQYVDFVGIADTGAQEGYNTSSAIAPVGYDTQTGQFQPIPLSEIIEARLQRCPAEAKHLLDVIAVAGKSAAPSEIIEVSGQSTAAFATLTHMRSERLLRLVGTQNDQMVDTYHDKIRETVLGTIGDARRRDLHLKYAEMIEVQSSDGESASTAYARSR